MNKIKFVGDKSQFIDGIPSRDLSEAEFNALSDQLKEAAIASGLYKVEAVAEPKKKTKKVME